jgi:hypothetical protein
MQSDAAHDLVGGVRVWAMGRGDIHAMALMGHGRGECETGSDLDLLLLTDRANKYRRQPKWLIQIPSTKQGFVFSRAKMVTTEYFCRGTLLAARG